MAAAGTAVAGQVGIAAGVARQPIPIVIVQGGPGGPPGRQVAETPQANRGRQGPADAGGRGRAQSRDCRDGSRGRSVARRRERSYDPRGASCSTTRSRSASAFRDRNTDDLLDDRLYTLSRILVKLCRHTGTDRGLIPSRAGWFPFDNVLAVAN
jgi:hypothetical protein